MLNPLEQYLQELAQSLRGLPAEEREAEVREVRHHLELLIARRMENGEAPEEATRAAIAQFGQPTSHGEDLKWARRRGQAQVLKQQVVALASPMLPSLQVMVTGGLMGLAWLTLFDMALVHLKRSTYIWMSCGPNYLIGLLYFSVGVAVGSVIWRKQLSVLKATLFSALFFSLGMGGLNMLNYVFSGVRYASPIYFFNFWSVSMALLAVAGALTGLLTAVVLRRLPSLQGRLRAA